MDNSIHIADLISKKIKGVISPEEMKELENWIIESPENVSVYWKATDPKNQLSKLEVYSLFRKDKVWSALEDELFKSKTINFISWKYVRYAAAILLPLIITSGVIYLYINKSTATNIAKIDSVFPPGSQRATLVLSNGGTVALDEKPLDDIIEGNVKITNQNTSLIYSDNKAQIIAQDLIFNELSTPLGGGYNITLADGSVVWLNAGSTLKFPVSFSDSTRKVFLEGEAYFEVSHNGKPFIVNSGNTDIRVLGTSFNVTAYQDDYEIITTLVEGKVRIDISGIDKVTNTSKILAPNEQAVVNRADSKIFISEVNTAQYTSWLNGKFEFNNETLNSVMKKLARWYDFEYEFENSLVKEYHFTGRINKDDNISTILEMIEMTCNVKFELREKTILVL